jgi:histidinol-phosphatase
LSDLCTTPTRPPWTARARFFTGAGPATLKPDGSEVTAADLAVEEMVHAGRGRGCFRTAGSTERLRVSPRTRLRGARTGMGNPGTWSTELMTTLHRTVFLTGVGDTAAVAAGRLDATVVAGAPMGYEDVAPLPVIVGEAGGRITDLAGESVLTGDGTVLASNGVLHDEFLALVAGVEHGRDWRALVARD